MTAALCGLTGWYVWVTQRLAATAVEQARLTIETATQSQRPRLVLGDGGLTVSQQGDAILGLRNLAAAGILHDAVATVQDLQVPVRQLPEVLETGASERLEFHWPPDHERYGVLQRALAAPSSKVQVRVDTGNLSGSEQQTWIWTFQRSAVGRPFELTSSEASWAIPTHLAGDSPVRPHGQPQSPTKS